MKPERLDKILSGTGLYSRTQARSLILIGAVSVDGVPLRRPEARVPRSAAIVAAGEEIDTAEFVYYIMNKPAGYVSASRDEGPLAAVTSLLPEHLRRRGLQCVGRLDADVTGLLLLTDDGAYAHRVTAPRSGVKKTYELWLDGPAGAEDVEVLARGVVLADGTVCRPAELRFAEGEPFHVFVTVTEGKYHEVKRLLASRGRRVLNMRRVSIGGLRLPEDLSFGEFHQLTWEEAEQAFI